MTNSFAFTRRRLLAVSTGLALSSARSRASGDGPRDLGIGGTGALLLPDQGPEDRGIGGTGVIGTIRQFGSIVVNGLRIAYPDSTAVWMDDERAPPAALRLGHVVEVLAQRSGDGLVTRRIDVRSEVVGPVEAVTPGLLTVLGQSIVPDRPGTTDGWRRGDEVAVAGLRRPDGMIVASLIERRTAPAFRVAGPVRRDRDGDLSIGGLKLPGLDEGLIEQRALVMGRRREATFEISEVRALRFATTTRHRPARLSVEAYVLHGARGLELGSGLKMQGGAALAQLPRNRAFKAIIEARVGEAGQLKLDGFRLEPGGHGSSGPTGGGLGPGGLGPGGPGPGGLGPGGPGPGGPGPGGPGPGGLGPGGLGPGGLGPGGLGPGGPGPGGLGPGGRATGGPGRGGAH